jgi:hypothetical protein
MRFYVSDHTDRRASGPASWSWLASRMSEQPEFSACITQRVLDMVYGGLPIDEKRRAEIRERFAKRGDFSALLLDVVLSRFVEGA